MNGRARPRGRLPTQIEDDAEKQNSDGTSLFASIRVFFCEIVEHVIERKALLSVAPNQQGPFGRFCLFSLVRGVRGLRGAPRSF